MRRRVLFSLLILSGPLARGDTIAFFYALDSDLAALKTEAREAGQPAVIGARRVHRLALGPHSVYAVKMGSGCVETAASAQAVLSRFRCDWAFSLGPAGSLTDALETGRWYRVARVVAWQRGTVGITGVSMSESSIWETNWDQFPVPTASLPFQSTQTLSVASGEMFVASSNERERIHIATGADVVDMNAFGLASVCADHGVPLFSWKVISDRADEDAPAAFRAFAEGYLGEGGLALTQIIGALPANPRDPASYPAIETLLREDPAK